MAATIPTVAPERIYSGDTLQFKLAVADYLPGDGWTLSYSFRKQGGDGSLVDFSTSQSGSYHYANVSADTTIQWLPGIYEGIGRVTGADGTFTVWRGTLEILPNLSQSADTHDPRSRAKKILDYIDSCWERVSKKGEYTSTSIEGVSLSFRSVAELQAARNYWLTIYNAEQSKISGKNNRLIVSQFINAT